MRARAAALGALASLCPPRSTPLDITGAPYALAALDATALCAVHDPAVIADGGTLFLFSTDAGAPAAPPFLALRASADGGATWATRGAVFGALPAWVRAAVPAAASLWAPDVSFFAGRFHVYYAASSFGSAASVIGLATTPSLAAPAWTDAGPVVASDAASGFNAIDPNLFQDPATGALLLLFGSFWSGIYALPVDAATGLPAPNATRLHLAQRAAPDALEGAFLIARGGFYYLFVSFDFCCRGAASNYSVHVGRARAAAGPYADRAGVPMLAGGGTRVAGGGHGWAAAGGASVLRGTDLFVAHAYDGETGAPYLNVAELRWDAEAWPSVVARGLT